jgi:hypothetical protein|tara:strand:- start:1127 stop:1456 length:330 start_codon:yes stop_codon:yes gene_type:complete
MKVSKVIGEVTVEFEAETVADAVKHISALEDVFGEDNCGHCQGANLRLMARESGGYQYYEVACKDCYHTLSFGIHQTGGTLFPKRRDQDGQALPNRGWQKWNPQTKRRE